MDDHLETQLEAAREQLTHRREAEDRLDMPRPIEHLAYFPRKAQAVQAAAALEEVGYETALARWRVLGAALEATRPDRLDEETVEAFMHEVHAIVVSHGGDYDGWGGEIAPDPWTGSGTARWFPSRATARLAGCDRASRQATGEHVRSVDRQPLEHEGHRAVPRILRFGLMDPPLGRRRAALEGEIVTSGDHVT